MHRLLKTIVAAVLVAATEARGVENETASNGFEVAFRSGVLIPAGDAAQDATLSDGYGVQFPLWIDLGYRLDRLFVGAYGQYAFGLLGSQLTCQSGTSCSEYALRVGLELQYHLLGRVRVDPWLGLGAGYEWDSVHASNSSESATVTLQGWEFLRLEAGVDFAVADSLRLGPFVGFSMGQFDHGSVSGTTGDTSQSIDQKALHFWICVGLKLTWVP